MTKVNRRGESAEVQDVTWHVGRGGGGGRDGVTASYVGLANQSILVAEPQKIFFRGYDLKYHIHIFIYTRKRE